MPQQAITYNGFVFPHPRLRVSEDAVFDPDSGIDQIGTRFTFTVTGHVTGATPAELGAELTCMRARLTVPRKSFTVVWDEGGGSLWSFDGVNNNDWGPTPGELSVENFAGGRAATYSWSMSVQAKDCASACSVTDNTTDILSTSRTWTHAVDENGFTTRTISGRLIVRASAVTAGRSADYYRYRLVPGAPTNYKRTHQVFTQSADGRELQYSVTDVEQMWALPQPVSSGHADFSVRLADLGMLADYRLSGKFSAPASVSKTTILDRIFTLIAAKFPLNAEGFFFEDREFTESVYENSVAFSVTARSSVGVTAGGGPDFAAALNQLTLTPPTNGVAQVIGPYGGDDTQTSGTIAQATKAYDACNPVPNNNPSTYQFGSVPQEQGASQPPPGSEGNFNSSDVSSAHKASPFESLHEVKSYELDNGIKFFVPKTANSKPIKQQVRPPSLTCIQAGYFRQYAKKASDVAPPPAPVFGVKGVILTAYVSAATPEPVGDGSWNLYTLRWRYVVQFFDVIADVKLAGVAPTFPQDLRRTSSTPENFPQLPDLAVLPG